MKIKYLYLSLFSLLFLNFSCKKDNEETITTYTQDEVNKYDKKALSNILNDYYFDEIGNIKKYDGTNNNKFPNLKTNSTELPSGIIIVNRPEIETQGDFATPDKKLTIQFNTFYFKSIKTSDNEGTYAAFNSGPVFSNILYGSGVPQTDSYFIHAPLYNEGDSKSDYEIEGIVEGLSHFKATKNTGLYNLQGVILVPSRLAYARDLHYYLPISTTKRTAMNSTLKDYCFVFNFEIKKVENR